MFNAMKHKSRALDAGVGRGDLAVVETPHSQLRKRSCRLWQQKESAKDISLADFLYFCAEV
ncbi:MAG TPA: hypothetical protein DD441_03390 [Parabacteroides distasonis]|nr:hypothetical protein [Parabacteroides distasonis]